MTVNKVLEIYNEDEYFLFPDLFLNAGETYEYQIVDRPSYVPAEANLVSASIIPNVWWDNPGDPWLTITNDGLLTGTADFGYFVGASNKDLQRLDFANDTIINSYLSKSRSE